MPTFCTEATHDAIKADPVAWKLCKLQGYLVDEDDDGKPVKIELRNCVCGDTLAVYVLP